MSLIVEPEYEAAWKQVERAFQDVVKLALADIGKTTRQIDRNTKAASQGRRPYRLYICENLCHYRSLVS